MDIGDSIESTIDKIKHQEQANEIKLKEQRALESSIAATNRLIRDTISRTSKIKDECEETVKRKDSLEIEVTTTQALRRALLEQLEASRKELQQLKANSEQGVLTAWNSRNWLCNEVQKVADQCDVWALFSKPNFIEIPCPAKRNVTENFEVTCEDKGKLEKALKRRQVLLEERERLMNEPDFGDEFMRWELKDIN